MRNRLRRFYIGFGWLSLQVIVCASNLVPLDTLAQTALTEPQGVQVFDTPSDGGGSLTVQWAPAPSDRSDMRYQVLVGEASASDPSAFTIIAEFPSNTHYIKDTKPRGGLEKPTKPGIKSWSEAGRG